MHFAWDGSTITNISHSMFEQLSSGRYSLSLDSSIRFRVEEFKNSTPLIIDELKPIFGLPKIGRHKVEYLDFSSQLLCRELGFERPVCLRRAKFPIDLEETYDIFKTRLFRWIVGLPTIFVGKDMIFRTSDSGCEVVSWRDEKIDFARTDPKFLIGVGSSWDPGKAMKEMLYGYTYGSLKDAVSDVIRRIDSSMIWFVNDIMARVSLYDFLEDDG